MNDLLDRVWPIFSAETREGLHELVAGVMELERPSSPGLLVGLRRIAHTIKGSAASLGLLDIEQLSHSIEDVLAISEGAPLPAAAVEALLAAVAAVEGALSDEARGRIAGLAGLVASLAGIAEPREDPAHAARGAQGAMGPELAGEMERLATAVAALCMQDGEERRAQAGRASAIAEGLAQGLRAEAAEVARRLVDTLSRIGRGGTEDARAIAAAAADVVTLRTGGAQPAQPRPEATAGARRGADGSVRVDSTRLESVAADVDQIVVGVAARERRGRELDRMEEELRDAAQQLRAGLAEARIRDELRPRAIGDALDRLRALEGAFARHARETRREAEREGLVAHGLREALQDLRMVPAEVALAALRPAVREAAARLGRKVRLALTGGEVRLDRRVLDELRGPLLHLVRNGVDHGIEPPAARTSAGKPEEALLEVRVDPRGDRVVFTVRDDGAGLSAERLRSAAVQRGLMTAPEAANLSDAEAARIAFRPGVSTAPEVTSLSGRGVGLDVVAEAVRRLGGTVDVASEPGRGTTFALEVPLALTGSAGLLVRAGGGQALLPLGAVESVLLVRPADVGTIGGRAMVSVDGGEVPYASLAQILGVGEGPSATETTVALLVSSGGRRAAIAVDEVLGEHPMVVASLGRRLAAVRSLAGAAVMDDGRVVAVLQPAELVAAQPVREGRKAAARGRILIADDSLSTRAAAKSILEIAGFAVVPVADGQEALDVMRGAGCDLVVSDVQMPRMDGLELTRRIKADPKLSAVPVILVTSLDAPEDRTAGLRAGADGYLVKREVARGALLDLVRRLLPG